MKPLSITIIIAFIAIGWCNKLHAQVNPKTNSLYAEIGGNSLYSINYDKLFPVSERLSLAPRIGFSYYGKDRFHIPVEANLLLAKNRSSKNFAEFGLGTTLLTNTNKYANNYSIIDKKEDKTTGFGTRITARIGFRHQKPEGGLMYRAGVLALVNTQANSNKVLPWAGFGIGYSF